MLLRSLLVSAVCSSIALPSLAFAAPMPNAIVVQDKAMVPVLKTEVIRRAAGQESVRQVTATVLEMSNQGKDIIAREIELEDNQGQFSEKQLSIPILQQGRVIVPTSKIELDKTLKQDGQVISQTKKIDAQGMEFKKGQEPVKRTLQLDQKRISGSSARVSHAVLTENGVVSKDVTVLSDGEE